MTYQDKIRQTGNRQTDRETNEQTKNRQTDKQSERQTDIRTSVTLERRRNFN